MSNIELKVNVDCNHASRMIETQFYCDYHQKWYKSYNKCNGNCVEGQKRINALEQVVRLAIEEAHIKEVKRLREERNKKC